MKEENTVEVATTLWRRKLDIPLLLTFRADKNMTCFDLNLIFDHKGESVIGDMELNIKGLEN